MENVVYDILKVVAVIGIPLGKFFQVYHIYVHKEVRDISLGDLGLSLFTYAVLTYEANVIGSTTFLIKNLSTIIPVAILLWFKWYYRDKEWHDDKDKNCVNCTNELEPHWVYCPDCGTTVMQRD